MEEGTARLRDRMLRDAILELLRSELDTHPGEAGRPAAFVLRVAVDGGCARVELEVTAGDAASVARLADAVQRRVESLPEVALAEVAVHRDGDARCGQFVLAQEGGPTCGSS